MKTRHGSPVPRLTTFCFDRSLHVVRFSAGDASRQPADFVFTFNRGLRHCARMELESYRLPLVGSLNRPA